DRLTYSASGLPAGASFNTASGAFSWTPEDGQAGTYVVTFEVTDGYINDSEAVTITVNELNHAPVLASIGAKSTNEGNKLEFTIAATDSDNDPLTYFAIGLPTGATFNPDTRTFSWTPGETQAGKYTVRFEVTDGLLTDAEDVTITVNDIQEDTTPPSVTYPTAAPFIIPTDTDSDPQWGESSRLNVTVTDDDGIASVTIDLSAIGGSAAQPMANIGGNIWSVATVASAGTPPQTYDLRVNATDIYGHSNTSAVISLTVVKNGDVNNDGKVDYIGDAVYLVRHTRNTPGYEEVLYGIADVTGDGKVDFVNDAVYLVRHTTNVPGYEILH
ncbi:MAG: putative Ig domain-containing protein, partial [ANME-2 cluster archaeon]|nr:putative Ig domain-containing protein [ANME-2 cluster archaeon]